MSPLEPLTLLLSAASGLVGALLTYFATRRGHEVSERTVYLGAVEGMTTMLRGELERVQRDRTTLARTVSDLEARLAQHEATERNLRGRIDALERERTTLRGRLGLPAANRG